MTILTNELFWIALSFSVFVAIIMHKSVKGKIYSALDQRIKKAINEVVEAEIIKKSAQMRLKEANARYSSIVDSNARVLQLAQTDAQALLSEATNKINDLEKQKNSLIDGYQNAQNKEIIDALKNDVLVTALNIVEHKFESLLQNKNYRAEMEDFDLQTFKKTWN